MVRRVVIGTVLLVVIAGAAFLTWAMRATPYVRDKVVEALNARFESQVALETLQASVLPHPEITGSGLELRHNGRTDVPPLISIERFHSGATIPGLLGQPLHLRNVTLDGLAIRIPAGGLKGVMRDQRRDPVPPGKSAMASIVIDEIQSNRARLEIASSKPGRLPRIFDIENLRMEGFGPTEGARFHAGLINPVPKGRIETSGVFGPWSAGEPELTPVRGEYAFKNADLDVIKGIGGILSSVGRYQGVLERIEVDGQTETPDFSLDIARQPVPLSTTFKAIVDGTNGDTYLERVEAKLGQSTILARGSVVRTTDVKGRRVTLDVVVDRARLEDLMRLAVHSDRPPIAGRVDVRTKFLLPAGSADVVDRLQLDGQFNLAQATFTNFDVQKKITLLSQRGRGDEASDGTGESVVSNLRGTFVLRNAQIDFSELQFAVPGAVVQLAGSYNLRAETIDFTGHLLADATLSDMTSGFKSVLARLAQPLFKKQGGGTRLPIKISGTRAKPSFGLDVRRVFKRG
jgi:hypothetical protein